MSGSEYVPEREADDRRPGQVYRYAIERRVIDFSDAVRGADAEILSSARPDIQIIELSLARAKTVDDLLRELEAGGNEMAIRLYFSLLYAEFHAGLRTAAWIANELHGLSRAYREAAGVLGEEIKSIDEWFEPWASGPETAALEVKAFIDGVPRVPLPEWLDPNAS